jgi:glutathionylspermidine synthase
MIRRECKPRANFPDIVRNQGLVYHTNADGSPYWNEEAHYVLSSGEITALYDCAKELHQMFLAAAGHILKRQDGLAELEIPAALHEIIRRSWNEDQWEFYGRFDLTFNRQGTPKLIEYNADTPTGLLEASIIQWYWKNDCHPRNDQFNSIHEALVNRWKELIDHRQIARELTHFTSVAKPNEDRMTIGYLARTAEEAAIPSTYLPIGRIGWDIKRSGFVDEQMRTIRQLFKLYPWEWLASETFAPHLSTTRWIALEPPWKAILASKKLLLTLQQLYPNHPYLLPVSDEPLRANYISKPVFGREGSNVALYQNGVEIDKRAGTRTSQSAVFQEYCPLVQAKPGLFAQCGVWMAGPEPVGLGIREDHRPILGNTSQFIPHLIA